MSPFVREALTLLALTVAAFVLAFLFAYTAKAAEPYREQGNNNLLCPEGYRFVQYLPPTGPGQYACANPAELIQVPGWLAHLKERIIPKCGGDINRDCYRVSEGREGTTNAQPNPITHERIEAGCKAAEAMGEGYGCTVVHVSIPATKVQRHVGCDLTVNGAPWPCNDDPPAERVVTITVEPPECASCGTEGDTGRVGPPPGWTPTAEEEAARQASVGDGGGESSTTDPAPTPTQTPASEPEPTPEEQWSAEQGECVSREAVTAAIVKDANTWRYSSNGLIAAWRANPC